MAEPNATPPEGQGTPPEGQLQQLPTTVAELQALLQAESDKRVTQALATANSKFTEKLETEKAEAARLAKLTADQREKEMFAKQQSEFAKQQAEFNQSKMLNQTMIELQKESLPVSFANYLLAESAEQVMENIKAFQVEWQTALQKAVDEKLKGTTPKGGSAPAKVSSNSFINSINKNQLRR